jgi:non-specific serine/threonine protein kinase
MAAAKLLDSHASLRSMTGRTVLHYEVGERLGAGGMGEVYRAVDTRLGRQVALKFLPASHEADLQSRERLLNEARAASILRSPNIAVTYDIGETDGAVFIVMEYVEGELVSQRVARGPLDLREAVDIAMQVADALDEAHSQGIVHRDIKSANLMLTGRGLVKVLDFGLAKFLPGASGLSVTRLQETAAGVVLGTVFYMSPEQVLARPVDHRTDLFSLGAVLYEMVTGRVPFDGATMTEVADKILHQDPPAVARFNYQVPVQLETILRKALQKDPGFRYQSARELYIDLRSLLRTIDSGQAGAFEPAGSGAYAAPLAAPRHANAVAVMTFSNITKEPADDWIGSGIAETVTADLKNIHGVTVIGRAQILDALKNLTPPDPHGFDDRLAMDVGRRLGATWIVGGGYQRLGGNIRITAHFIDLTTSGLVKTVKVDGRIDDIFELQDRIVYELSKGLSHTLNRGEIAEIERDETQSVEAYEAYSRGLVNLRTGSRDSLDRAIYLLEKATEHDPKYASAWVALGAAYDLKGDFLRLPELIERAIEYERRAIELNPRLADAYRWLGGSLLDLGRPDEAIAAYEEALRIEPNHAAALGGLGRAYWIGKGQVEKAVPVLERALAVNPDHGYAYLQLSFLYTVMGQHERAEQAARSAVALQERATSGKEGLQIVGAHARLGYALYRQGRLPEAITEYERELAFLTSSDHALAERTTIELYQKLGAAHLASGNRDEANRFFDLAIAAFDRRVARGADDPFTKYYVAAVYCLRGDLERAARYFAESTQLLPAVNRARARTDPDLDGLRHDPTFSELVA